MEELFRELSTRLESTRAVLGLLVYSQGGRVVIPGDKVDEGYPDNSELVFHQDEDGSITIEVVEQ